MSKYLSLLAGVKAGYDLMHLVLGLYLDPVYTSGVNLHQHHL